MNKIFSFILCCAVVSPAVALTPAGQSRRSVQAQMVESAPRATASKNQLAAMATSTSVSSVASADVSKSSVRVEPEPVAAEGVHCQFKTFVDGVMLVEEGVLGC